MTYLQFHFVFTIPLFFGILFLVRKNPLTFSKKGILGTSLLLFLALFYTTPWDSYLIHQGIWTYEAKNVLGTLLKIPFEEYFFFIIQTLTGCFFTSLVLIRFKAPLHSQMEIGKTHIGALAFLFLVLGLSFFTFTPPSQYIYLSLIFFWAFPVLLAQWVLGFKILRKNLGTWVLAVTALTTYFCFADSVAIQLQIWTFPENTISGIELFGILPIEEALFFLVTNLMVVQGYILFTTVDFSKTHLNLGLGNSQ